jgi:ketosteroid isomerase-like protein
MATNSELLQTFYEAFSRRDYQTMGQCYHEEAIFNDPAFVNLNAQEVRAMWQMLCERGTDLKLEFSDIQTNENTGKCHWEAYYTFSQTRRKVHNIIDAEFEFKEGKIWRHTDKFNFYRWAKQALGMTGWLLGWTSFLQTKVQETARKSLDKFMQRA